MAGQASIIAVLSLPIVFLPEPSSAAYMLNVRLYTYRNRNHRDSSGDCCDYIIFRPRRCRDDCDNIFTFCLQPGASVSSDDNCSLGRDSFRHDNDSINFPPDSSSIHSFSSLDSWPGSATLFVRIEDYDLQLNSNNLVDNIYIPVHLNPGQSTPRRTYRGDYGRSRFELRCQPNFYGEDCLTNCIPTDNDSGHFGCGPQGERLCLDGWRDPGNHCLTPICIDCNPIGGDCTAPGQCTCQPGWSGTQCKQCIEISTGCSMEGGYCDIPGECRCLEGYRGDNCEVYLFPCNREPEPCENGATCIDDGRGGYTCNCSSGYGGRNCTIPCDTPHDICSIECNNLTNPCENGGICQTQNFRDGASRSSCVCRQGFSGEYCEISVDDCWPNPCRNGGTCQSYNSMCICAEGYTGIHCEVDIDYCLLTQPCQNSGTCMDLAGINYICSCPDGWTGQNCSEERNECEEFQPCQNGAHCIDLFDDYECDCVPGFMGRDCEQEIDGCSPVNPCINGNCTDLLNSYTCICFDQFTGSNCEIDLNSCHSAPCHNGGSCRNEPNGFYTCTCFPGYTGFDCEATDNCLTMSSLCSNQGTCISTEDSYYCVCDPGFSGRNCSIALNQVPFNQEHKGPGVHGTVGRIVGGVFSLVLFAVIIFIIVILIIKKASRATRFNMNANAAYKKATGQETEYYYSEIKETSPATRFNMKVNAAYTKKTTGQEDTEYYYTNFDDIEKKSDDSGLHVLSTSTHYYEIIHET